MWFINFTGNIGKVYLAFSKKMNIKILEATTIQRQIKQIRIPKKSDNSKWIDNIILLGKK